MINIIRVENHCVNCSQNPNLSQSDKTVKKQFKSVMVCSDVFTDHFELIICQRCLTSQLLGRIGSKALCSASSQVNPSGSAEGKPSAVEY